VNAASLRALAEATAAKRAIVIVRALDAPGEWLIEATTEDAALSELPTGLRAAGREALRRDGARVLEADGRRYLVQTLAPPHRLIVVGAVHIAQALIPMAQAVGFAVTLVDPRPAFASAARFPGVDVRAEWPQDVFPEIDLDARTAVVTLSHDPKIDEPALAAALRAETFYIGALGSRRNHAGRLERLAEAGFEASALERIAGPAGLDLGGRAPAEIAVAIVAQLVQARYSN
jgi:xanthine dehydrogenase accessory factor